MAVEVLYRADILIDGVAASTDSNKVKVTVSQEKKEVTTFQCTSRRYIAGLNEPQAQASGNYQSGAGTLVNITEAKFPSLSSFTACTVQIGHSQVEGDPVDLFAAVPVSMEYDGQDGEVYPFSFDTRNSNGAGAVRGTRLLRAAQTASSGSGTAFQLGAVTSVQSIYAAINVVQTTGTTAGVTFTLVSAASSGMGGATTRITFTPGTSAIGAQFTSVAGSITDTWWQARWAGFPAGATQGFTAGISAGIQ